MFNHSTIDKSGPQRLGRAGNLLPSTVAHGKGLTLHPGRAGKPLRILGNRQETMVFFGNLQETMVFTIKYEGYPLKIFPSSNSVMGYFGYEWENYEITMG